MFFLGGIFNRLLIIILFNARQSNRSTQYCFSPEIFVGGTVLSMFNHFDVASCDMPNGANNQKKKLRTMMLIVVSCYPKQIDLHNKRHCYSPWWCHFECHFGREQQYISIADPDIVCLSTFVGEKVIFMAITQCNMVSQWWVMIELASYRRDKSTSEHQPTLTNSSLNCLLNWGNNPLLFLSNLTQANQSTNQVT